MAEPSPDTILVGPFWPCPVRVLRAIEAGSSVRIEAVGVGDGKYYDRTLTAKQYEEQVKQHSGSSHTFDADPALFRLAVEALRTHLAHAFDPQFAVSVSQVDPLPHQLDAVYKHILPLPRIRFLLADDPGAGKTIMAGLLMREMMQRGEVKRVLVLCPKAVTDQWRREMWERFRLRFTLLTGDLITDAFGGNAWTKDDLVVASIDLAIQDHILPTLEQSRWDLVVFDEAHKLSAYRYGPRGKVYKRQRYLLAEMLSAKTRHMLLLTATPHKGDDENFRLLLALLDDKVFASQAGMRRALFKDDSPYFLRRMKESMKDFNGKPLFLPRYVETPKYKLASDEQRLYDAVTDYVAAGLAQAEASQNRNVGLALTVLQRRLASSIYAVTRSLERRQERLAEELEAAKRAGRLATKDAEVDWDEEEEGELTDEQERELSGASNARNPEELANEVQQLERLISLARSTKGPERKLTEFLEAIKSESVQNRSEKILVFTEHKDTLTYLTNEMKSRGYSVCNIHGGMSLQERISAEKEFRGAKQFMVATEAAGEGINLQFCRVMINWDLPWNPNRLEQRMGRIHRYGQEFEVHIVNLVAEGTREGDVLIRLMDKLKRMRQSLGNDQVYDVIATVLEAGQVRLDTLIREAILKRRSKEEILGELDVVEDPASIQAARVVLGEALATSHIDMAFILGDQRESKERRLTPEFVEHFFVDALRHLGGKVPPGKDMDWRLDAVPADVRRLARAANSGEFGTESRLITFRKERLRRDPPAEFVAPDHPLFDAVLGKTLEEGLSALARGTVFIDKQAQAPYLVWLLEAAVVNGEGQTVHRRLLALKQQGEAFTPVAPGLVLDLEPQSVAPPVSADLQSMAKGARAISAASEYYGGAYLAEVTKEQERQASVIERALDQSVRDNLDELQARLGRQYEDLEKGKDMAIAIRTTNELIEGLVRDLDARRKSLSRCRVTSIETPRVVGVAAVGPGPVPAAVEKGLRGGDQTAVEQAAMKMAMDYERACGRVPEDVSRRGEGYDVRSLASDGSARYIEVKGHATTGDVTMYYTEWQMANRLRSEYFLYEVNDAFAEPKLRIIPDPVGKGIKPVEKVVEYHIDAAQITAIAQTVATHSA